MQLPRLPAVKLGALPGIRLPRLAHDFAYLPVALRRPKLSRTAEDVPDIAPSIRLDRFGLLPADLRRAFAG